MARRLSQLSRYLFSILIVSSTDRKDNSHPKNFNDLGKIFYYFKILTEGLIFPHISLNYRYGQRRIFFKKEEPEQFFGAFAQIQLVDNKTCDLSPNSIDDICSKYDPFLARPDTNYYANNYRRQNENLFSFNSPTCNRRC